MNKFTKEFWAGRWQDGQTGWDIGNVSTPFLDFFASLKDKEIRILIPGGGNGYEGEYLWQQGFSNVYLLDIVEQPLENFKKRVPDFPQQQLICADFFSLTEKFDLIIEQTFFCALDPILRSQYAIKMSEVLSQGSKLAGLLFNFPLTEEGPPFGGDENEYRNLFEPFFYIQRMEVCANSIKPRAGRELWFEMIRK
jgi:methyl halide transferase